MVRMFWRRAAALSVCLLIPLTLVQLSLDRHAVQDVAPEAVTATSENAPVALSDTMLYPGTPIPDGFYTVANPDWRWPNPGGTNPPKGTPVTITYSMAGVTDLGLSCSDARSAIREALQLWATYAPLNFVEVPDAGACPTSSDTQYSAAGTANLRFGTHGFDGTFGVLAHTYFPSSSGGISGDLHFDCGEEWDVAPGGGSTIDFLEVCVHELGHALGLDHEPTKDAIMNAYYAGRYSGLGSAYLLQDDINGIRAIYGSGQGSVVPLSGAGCGSCTTSCDPGGGGGGCPMEALVDEAFALPGFSAFPEIEHLLVPPTPTPATKGTSPKAKPERKRGGRRQSLLDSLRHFRDTALASSAEGRQLIQLYYRHGDAVTKILSDHPELAIQSLVLVARCVPALDAAADSPDGTLALKAEHYEQGMELIHAIRNHGSNELSRDLGRLEMFLVSRRKGSDEATVVLELKDAPVAAVSQ